MSPWTRRQALTTLGTAAVTVPLAAGLAAPATAHGEPRRRVLLIDIDGFDPRLLDGEYADLHSLPHIRALRAAGASGTATTSYSSYSNSCRTTMATGTYPDVHRNSAYYINPETGLAVTQERYIEPGVETIAQAL